MRSREEKIAYWRQYYYDNKHKWQQRHKENYARDRHKIRRRVEKLRWKRDGFPEPPRPRPETCELCGGPPNGRGAFNLDHCHETGEFRGWICAQCNIGLGALGDNEAGLERALAYLKRKGAPPSPT